MVGTRITNAYNIYTVSGSMPNQKPYYSTAVNDNGANTTVRYFSSCDAEIFFGDVFVNDIAYIDFTLNQATMMLYGYNSYVFDEIAKGARMIQGKFMVNFTRSAYLYDVLNTLIALENYNNNLQYSEHAPLWDKGFDLYVSYGNAKQDTPMPYSQLIVLKNVHLTGCEQEINSKTGDPIAEIYSFVARDIEFNVTTPLSTNSEQPIITSDMLAITKVTFSDDFTTMTVTFNKEVTLRYIAVNMNDEGGLNTLLDNNNLNRLMLGDEAKTSLIFEFALDNVSLKKMKRLQNEFAQITLDFYLDYTLDAIDYQSQMLSYQYTF